MRFSILTAACVSAGLLASGSGVNAQTMPLDRQFMMKAAHINIGEVKGGELAQTRAVNAYVRDYAQHMIEDHSSANMKLKQLASSEGVNLPNDTDQKHKVVANRLAKLSGAPFDRAYMLAMVRGHKEAIMIFQNQAKNGRDPEIRSFAAGMIPGLRMHLSMAQDIYNSRSVQRGAKAQPGELSHLDGMLQRGSSHPNTHMDNGGTTRPRSGTASPRNTGTMNRTNRTNQSNKNKTSVPGHKNSGQNADHADHTGHEDSVPGHKNSGENADNDD